MKIQVAQTLPNGQVTQQVLSKGGVEALKIQAQPGAEISFNVEGDKPVGGMNVKPKTGNIKKVGNNLVLESEGEALVEITDFYSTAGASVGDVSWNYAAQDADVMTATPEAQALSSDAAVSDSGALLPAIAPGWLVAGGAAVVAVATSGGSSAVGTTVISGSVVLGPVKAGNGLTVTLYKADGSELAAAVAVGADGKFTSSYSAAYTGVVMARLKDSSSGVDYRDEATHADKDLTSDIRALFSSINAGTTNITLSALSEIAVRQILGDSGGDNGTAGVAAGTKTATEISAKNAALAVSLGLTGNVVTDFTINPTVNADGTAATANTAGLIVAALSGLDAIYGTDGALDLLAATGISSASVVELVAEGAQQAGVLTDLSTAVAAVGTVVTAAATTAAAVTASGLSTTTLAALSPLVLAQLTTTQIAAIPDTAMAGLTVAQLAAFTPAQVGAITATQVDNLIAAQIVALGNDVSSFTAAAVASLDAAQVSALTPAQVSALTPAQAAAFSATQVDSLSAAQVAALTPSTLAGLTATAVASLDATQIAALTTAQAAAFTAVQAAAITSTQVDSFSAAQVAALAPSTLAGLTATAVASLDATQIAALTTAQTAAFTATQVAALTSTQVVALSAAQLNALAAVSTPTSALALSNDSTPTITGTFSGLLPVGAEIHVYDGTNDLGAASITVVGGTWSFTPTVALPAQGAHSLTAKIQISGGSSATASAAFVFTLDSLAPTITAAYTTNENAGTDTTAHTITLVGTDANGPVAFSGLTGADAAKFTLSGNTLTFAGQTNYEAADDAGADHVYDVSVVGADILGNAVTHAITVTVGNVNEAPATVGTIAAQTAVVGIAYTLGTAASFVDVDAGGLTGGVYTATGLGNGLTIDASTGVISGTALANAAAAPVVVTFTDAGGLAVSQTAFNLTAVSAPVVQSIAVTDATGVTTQGKSGEALSFVVTLSEAVTTTGTLTAHFSVNGLDVTATSAAVTSASTITFTTGVVPATGNGTAISLTSLVADSGTIHGNLSNQDMVGPTAGAVAYAGYTVDNTAPTVSTTNFNVAENATAMTTSGALAANETVTWSLGSGADTALFSLSGNTLSLLAAKNYEADETTDHAYTLNLIATDAVGNATTQVVTVNLTNVNEAPTASGTVTAQTAVNGQAYNFDVHTYFADPDTTAPNNTLTYSATGLPTGVTINAATGVISGTATADRTASSVVVTATDGGSLSITQSFNLAVVSAPTVSSFTVADTTGTTTLGKSGEALSFVVTLSEAVTTSAGLTAHFSVNGQDVTATSAAVTGTNTITFTGASVPGTGNNGTAITLTSLIADSGTIHGDLSNQDMVGPTAGAVAYAGYTVDNTAPTVSTTNFNVAENATAMTTSGALAANETVTWSLGSGADTALFSLSGNTLSLLAAKNYEADETTDHAYTLNLIATDAVGNATTQVVTVNLTNVNEAPTVASALVDQTAVLGQAFSYTFGAGAFTDVDASTTLTYSATLSSGAALSAATGWTNLAFDAATRTISGTATNETTGDVTVRVTGSDGTLSVYDDVAIDAVSAPTLATTLGGTTNLDVRSALVFSVSEDVNWTANGTYDFVITNAANGTGKTGFRTESTAHTQTIHVVVDAMGAATVTGGSVTIDHVNNKIVIDPTFDLDLSNNYTLSAATGAFTGVTSHQASQAFTSVNFSTVTPGSSSSFYVADPAGDGSLPPAVNPVAAAASVIMNTTTGAKDVSLSWVDVTNATAMGQDIPNGIFGIVDASAKDYAFTLKNINTSSSTMKMTDTWAKFTNFGAQDLIYIDNQFNDGFANWLNTGAFGGGKGTAVDPFSVTTSGSSLSTKLQVVVDSSVVLPTAYTAGPYVNSLLTSVNANHWSDTGVVIAA